MFDNAAVSYSKDPSTSKEKEDMDVFTYRHARIGGRIESGIETLPSDETSEAPAEYYTIDGVRVSNPAHGLYIVRRGSKVSKVML